MNAPAPPPLCIADDATFWAWRRWPEFVQGKTPPRAMVVVPIVGMADWGLGHPLDVEETVLLHVLRAVSVAREPGLPLLVVPPLRFVLGPDPGCAFPVDPPVAHELVGEVLGSIAASGFRRVVLFNASPWNEEFIAVAARDNRIAHRLQIFRISLSGLGLDLHPTRSQVRRKVQTLVTALTGKEPEPPRDGSAPPVRQGWGDESVTPLAGPALPLAQAQAEGAVILAEAAAHLLTLLDEIYLRPPLAHDGAILPAQFPLRD